MAYLFMLEQDDNLDISNYDTYNIKNTDYEGEISNTFDDNPSNKPVSTKVEVISEVVTSDSDNDTDCYDVNALNIPENITSCDDINPNDIDPLLQPTKSLYEGFMEKLYEIRKQNMNTIDSVEKSELENTDCRENTNHTSKFLEKINSDIARNQENLDNIDNVCKDVNTKDTIRDRLLDEKKYLLEQKIQYCVDEIEQQKTI